MGSIKVKTEEEIEILRVAGKIAAQVLDELRCRIRVGVTTEELDKIGEKLIREKGAAPAFLGYRGYRFATCISVNEEVVHGLPSGRALAEGDIVGIDVGVKYQGYFGDNAATYPVGKVSAKAQKLLRAGKQALKTAIKQMRAGNHLGDVSWAIQQVAEKNGFSVVRELYGHGVGKDLHEDPLVPNFGKKGEGPLLKPGMVLAVEPMINMGGWEVVTLSDGWTVVTKDRSLSCHFEHTVLVTEGEPEILTHL